MAHGKRFLSVAFGRRTSCAVVCESSREAGIASFRRQAAGGSCESQPSQRVHAAGEWCSSRHFVFLHAPGFEAFNTTAPPTHQTTPPNLITFLAFAMSWEKPSCIFLGITILSASAGSDPSPGLSADCAGCPNDADADTEPDRIPPAPDRAACFSLSFSLCAEGEGGTRAGGGKNTVGEGREYHMGECSIRRNRRLVSVLLYEAGQIDGCD